MKALQATCIVGAVTFTGMMIHQVGGNTPGATVPAAMPEAAVSETPGVPALSAAVEASAGPGTVLGAGLGSVPGAGSGPSLMARAEIGDDSFEAKWMALGHHDAAQPMPTTHNAPDDAPNPAPVTQDFRYLIYYVSSELPPCREAGGYRFTFAQGHPGRNAGRGDQARFRRFRSGFQFHESGCQDRVRFRPQATHWVLYRPIPTEQIRVQQNLVPGRFLIRATMRLRRPTRSLPKAFCSSG